MHLFGRPAGVEELPELPLLEDAAGALGASAAARPAGSLGNVACFSFHPRKVVTTGEGGAVTTSDPGRRIGAAASPSRLAAARLCGHAGRGLNYRISDLSCASESRSSSASRS